MFYVALLYLFWIASLYFRHSAVGLATLPLCSLIYIEFKDDRPPRLSQGQSLHLLNRLLAIRRALTGGKGSY